MYLVSLYYKGAMNVDNMRLLKTKTAVLERLKDLGASCQENDALIKAGSFRVYCMSANFPPVNLTKEFGEEYISWRQPAKKPAKKPAKVSYKPVDLGPPVFLKDLRVGDIVFIPIPNGRGFSCLLKRLDHPLEAMCGIPRFRVVASIGREPFSLEVGKLVWFYREQSFVRYDEKKHDTTGMAFMKNWRES